MAEPIEQVPASQRLNMDNKVVVVTGGARGIGRATAIEFAKLGADIAVIDRLEDELADTEIVLQGFGAQTYSEVGDVRDDGISERFLESASDSLGSVDVLVNNAGGGFWSPFETVSAGGQAALISENFTQVADWSRAAIAHLSSGSAIVNVTSIEGHRAGPGFGIYSAMKAAVENLTKTLALELAPKHIRVNAIAPDMIPTPGDEGLSADSGALADDAYASQPLPHLGSPTDVANAAVFLASDLAAFITGSTIHVDGGTFAASGWRRSKDGDNWML